MVLDNADEVRRPGAHPIYGGLNWGYSRSEHWGDWNVNHGYYGSHSIGPDGRRLFDGQPIPNDLALWTCDQPDRARARRTWAARDAISTELAERGLGVAGSVARMLPPLLPDSHGTGIRIRVTFHGPRAIQVAPFDWPDDFFTFEVS